MKVPSDITLTLRPGSVYYFEHRELSSAEPHFFIVLNSDPISQQILLMSVFTSKIDTQQRRIQRAGHPPETLVPITPTDYPELSLNSCVNCNKVFTKPLAELIAQWSTLRKKPLDLPLPILAKILNGIKLSPEVSEEEKQLILKIPDK